MSTMAESVLQALGSLTTGELAEVARQAQQAVAEQRQAFWPNAKETIDKLATEAGVTPAELFVRLYPPVPAPAKFVHPEDPKKTWSGRGKKPKWMEEHQAASGKSLDSYLIAPPEAVGVTSEGEVVEGVPGPDGE